MINFGPAGYITLGILTICMLIYFYIKYDNQKDFEKKREKLPGWLKACPDYWTKSRNRCINKFNIGGKCGTFSPDGYSRKQKRSFVKRCQAPWAKYGE